MSPSAARDRARAETTAGLSADIGLRLGTLDLEVAVAAAPGEVVAILGPNGAGKTTLLRAVAGLLPIDRGRIIVAGRTVDDADTRLRTSAQQRSVGVVFQQHLLFPHLSALENVAFGLRARGTPRRAARTRARGWLERVGLDDRLDAKPSALSGGQAQRVALARALATDPALLLLDEPLSALDVDARREMRRQLRRHLGAFTGPTLLVTHEPLEAIALADRLVIVERGHVVQDDLPSVIARRPRSPWAARLVGLNHYQGRVHGHHLVLDSGATLTVATPAAQPTDAFATFHPRDVALYSRRPDGSPRNCWQGVVDAIDIQGDDVRVHLDGPIPVVAQVTAASLADLALTEGSTVWAAVKATEVEHWPV